MPTLRPASSLRRPDRLSEGNPPQSASQPAAESPSRRASTSITPRPVAFNAELGKSAAFPSVPLNDPRRLPGAAFASLNHAMRRILEDPATPGNGSNLRHDNLRPEDLRPQAVQAQAGTGPAAPADPAVVAGPTKEQKMDFVARFLDQKTEEMQEEFAVWQEQIRSANQPRTPQGEETPRSSGAGVTPFSSTTHRAAVVSLPPRKLPASETARSAQNVVGATGFEDDADNTVNLGRSHLYPRQLTWKELPDKVKLIVVREMTDWVSYDEAADALQMTPADDVEFLKLYESELAKADRAKSKFKAFMAYRNPSQLSENGELLPLDQPALFRTDPDFVLLTDSISKKEVHIAQTYMRSLGLDRQAAEMGGWVGQATTGEFAINFDGPSLSGEKKNAAHDADRLMAPPQPRDMVKEGRKRATWQTLSAPATLSAADMLQFADPPGTINPRRLMIVNKQQPEPERVIEDRDMVGGPTRCEKDREGQLQQQLQMQMHSRNANRPQPGGSGDWIHAEFDRLFPQWPAEKVPEFQSMFQGPRDVEGDGAPQSGFEGMFSQRDVDEEGNAASSDPLGIYPFRRTGGGSRRADGAAATATPGAADSQSAGASAVAARGGEVAGGTREPAPGLVSPRVQAAVDGLLARHGDEETRRRIMQKQRSAVEPGESDGDWVPEGAERALAPNKQDKTTKKRKRQASPQASPATVAAGAAGAAGAGDVGGVQTATTSQGGGGSGQVAKKARTETSLAGNHVVAPNLGVPMGTVRVTGTASQTAVAPSSMAQGAATASLQAPGTPGRIQAPGNRVLPWEPSPEFRMRLETKARLLGFTADHIRAAYAYMRKNPEARSDPGKFFEMWAHGLVINVVERTARERLERGQPLSLDERLHIFAQGLHVDPSWVAQAKEATAPDHGPNGMRACDWMYNRWLEAHRKQLEEQLQLYAKHRPIDQSPSAVQSNQQSLFLAAAREAMPQRPGAGMDLSAETIQLLYVKGRLLKWQDAWVAKAIAETNNKMDLETWPENEYLRRARVNSGQEGPNKSQDWAAVYQKKAQTLDIVPAHAAWCWNRFVGQNATAEGVAKALQMLEEAWMRGFQAALKRALADRQPTPSAAQALGHQGIVQHGTASRQPTPSPTQAPGFQGAVQHGMANRQPVQFHAPASGFQGIVQQNLANRQPAQFHAPASGFQGVVQHNLAIRQAASSPARAPESAQAQESAPTPASTASTPAGAASSEPGAKTKVPITRIRLVQRTPVAARSRTASRQASEDPASVDPQAGSSPQPSSQPALYTNSQLVPELPQRITRARARREASAAAGSGSSQQ